MKFSNMMRVFDFGHSEVRLYNINNARIVAEELLPGTEIILRRLFDSIYFDKAQFRVDYESLFGYFCLLQKIRKSGIALPTKKIHCLDNFGVSKSTQSVAKVAKFFHIFQKIQKMAI